MTLYPTYTRRRLQSQAGGNDVYQYDQLSQKLRVQITQVFGDAIHRDCYSGMVRLLRREFGVHALSAFPGQPVGEFNSWLLNEKDINNLLDGLEIGLQTIDRHMRKSGWVPSPLAEPDAAIAEVNARLKEAVVGYSYEAGKLIRIDDQLVHHEVVVPALELLHDPRFQTAEQEYRDAHEAYREGRLEDCIVACGKAFESVLKVIGQQRHWAIQNTDSANQLVQAAVKTGFLVPSMQTSLNHLAGLISSSTPMIRNKHGGHGAGTRPHAVPTHLAALQLHQTAAVIIYIVEQDKVVP
jgi:hypothetical protein